MTARFLHSWPTEQTMGKEEFIKYQKEIQAGCPDWNYRASIWKPPKQGSGEAAEVLGRTVYLVIHVICTHTSRMKLLGDVFEPSDPPVKITMPYELLQIGFNMSMEPPQIESYESRKIISAHGCTTGGLAGVPGLLHALHRPLPPPVTDLLAPVPPYSAPDNRDPNFKLRIQVFKKIAQDQEAKVLLDLIKRQKDEIQQFMDYLNAIRNYC
eukprot:CAMPEP_0181306910 /NCGR_PEP_ID=MMETSP1101-20121128/10568_1 /TAXON_ID=46948 /ORGANISM="Rhodomonas abbreviata, Strain Caron Lab Isolate" /LENGTH=210 /DNA_ID=CAMNT_0023413031 /DNA_START=164 /DNA_END=796 /DNA_ORIENTATION=-